MAFNLLDWLGFNKKKGGVKEVTLDELAEHYKEFTIREIAFWTCVTLISNVFCKCEFKTFYKNKEVKKREYYRWNVEPNKNQNASEFRHKMIAKLLRENECLIIEYDNNLYIADSFSKKESVIIPSYFTEVRVGEVTFKRNFYYNEALYIKFSNKNTGHLLQSLDESYSNMISSAIRSYSKNRGTKAIYESGALPEIGTEEYKKYLENINNKLKTFINNDNAVFPLGNGENLREYGNTGAYSKESSRDVRSLIDDIFDFTARSLLIPPALLKGEITEDSQVMDVLLTVCINPLVKNIQNEINRRIYKYSGFEEGSYLIIDTKGTKYVDLLSVASAIDKLISSGTFCINDIRELCGEPIIDEPWAYEHFITKNYEKITRASENAKIAERGEKE